MAAPNPPVSPPRAALHTLGCRLNHTETEALRRQLEGAGYRIVPWGEPAELCVLNSCTVTAQADAKTRQALGAVRRNYPQARLALVGCYAQVQGMKAAQGGLADLVIGNGRKMELLTLLPRWSPGSAPLVVTPTIGPGALLHPTAADLRGPTRATLKIQDGCDFMCSFCIIPTARGRARPRQLANLLAEAEAMAEAGAREVVLTGVNLGTFQQGATGFAELLDRLDALPGLARIRISSIEPTTVGDPVLERMADPAHKTAPHLHLPLQSGSDTVLAAMRRRYTAPEYHRFAEKALARVPGLCLGTDVLVGFPGEDDAAFEQTRALLAALPFAYCHVFPYSRRTGTAAVRLAGQVPAPEKQARVAALRALSRRQRERFHQGFQGTTRPVLFEKPKKAGEAKGYTDNYIPVAVAAPDADQLRNQLVPVRLLRGTPEKMEGALHPHHGQEGRGKGDQGLVSSMGKVLV